MNAQWRRVSSALGELLVTAGLVLLLFCSYELWGTGVYTEREQNALESGLDRAWSAPVSPAPGAPAGAGARPVTARLAASPLGSGIARLWVPRFGTHFARVVVEGVSVADLKKGPGHYPGTAGPGQLGNMVISGHRTTYGQPFHRIAELVVGDALVVETRDTWFTYRVTGSTVVAPTMISVTYPVPGQAGRLPTQALLTLTSCHPEYSARQRWVTLGLLESRLSKRTGARPPALAA